MRALYCAIAVDVDARDLLSFPTRRSSDLLGADERNRDARPVGGRRVKPLGPVARGVVPAEHLRPLERSEEHTSELQSHHDLVCRLLLEKTNAHHKTPR